MMTAMPTAAAMVAMVPVVRRGSIRRLCLAIVGRQRDRRLRLGDVLLRRCDKKRRNCQKEKTERTFHGISPKDQKSPVGILNHKKDGKSLWIL
jgi:hypothetical protein